MSRAEALAADLVSSYTRFAEYLEGLSAEQWRTPAVNHPEMVMGEDEKRPVGVLAHHVGDTIPMFAERARRTAEGDPLDPITTAEMDAANARHAASNARPDQAETVAMIRDNLGRAADMIQSLSDHDLGRTGAGAMSGFTAEQLIQRVLIGHVKWHEGSIRAALEESSRPAGPRSQTG
jgi:DinB family protein